MHILLIGLNHSCAPLHLRERLAFTEEQARAAMSDSCRVRPPSSLSEVVLLSTCNRMEIYAASGQPSFTALEAFLQEARGPAAQEALPLFYRLRDLDAAAHLFDVAAGLDSQVVGEPQILGQVGRSLELAQAAGSAGPLLNRLFQAAVHAGKRVRTETGMGRHPASVSSLAASVAARSLGDIASANVVVIGAGETAERTVEALRKRGASRIQVVNRTPERARALAARWDAEAVAFDSLYGSLCQADILISSTGSTHCILPAEMVARAMQARPERRLVLVDIAVPRDIEPAAGQVPGVALFDIDSLQSRLEDSQSLCLEEMPQARRILEQELAGFEAYLRSLEILPIIADIRQQAEAIRAQELEKALRRLPGLSEAERGRIEAMTRALVQKLLDHPTRRLRAEAASLQAPEYAALARTLFNLTAEPADPPGQPAIDRGKRIEP